MNLPAPIEVFEKSIEGEAMCHSTTWYENKYKEWLEQQNVKMRDALIEALSHAKTLCMFGCESCQYNDKFGIKCNVKICKDIIELATGITIDDAIKTYEETK